ncbi:MAG: 4Fe-4S binding protein [Deltaproteobacteria bacterium]|nr:4Fe-4S binding protein [Deltaproteobacteria bacterium]
MRIISKKCNGCGNCVIVCGGEVFEIKKKKAVVVHIEHCLECGNCEVACLRNAIHFRVPRGGTGIVYRYG